MTPRAVELLTELSIRGVLVIPDGERLRLQPRSALTPELLARVQEIGPELLAMLKGRGLASLESCGAWLSAHEWAVLVALARCPGLVRQGLGPATGLRGPSVERAVRRLLGRGEICRSRDGRLRLAVT
jgi:DNA-binding MarR family transcriptional regulator